MQKLVRDGIEAFRLTREYVGAETLPAVEGWSWFDWVQKATAALDKTIAEAPDSPPVVRKPKRIKVGPAINRKAPDTLSEKPGLDVEALRTVAAQTRDLLANYLWNEDDSGDENDLVAAYDHLKDILGPSTETDVGATLAKEHGSTDSEGR